jgi:hypothetical protein
MRRRSSPTEHLARHRRASGGVTLTPMTRRRTPIAILVSASLVFAVGLAGCGLGEMPTRQPTASPSLRPTAPPSSGPTASLPPAPPATPQPSPTQLAYLVQPGDNLLSIARRYRTTGRSIAYWNRATYPSLDPDRGGLAPRAHPGGRRGRGPEVTPSGLSDATTDGQPVAGSIVTIAASRAQGGSIRLRHFGGWNTLAGLPGCRGPGILRR